MVELDQMPAIYNQNEVAFDTLFPVTANNGIVTNNNDLAVMIIL